MNLKRAHSVLNIKSSVVKDGERIIQGVATTPSVDSHGDIVDPLGAIFSLPMPLLWQHEHDKPVGFVEFASPTKDGIPFRARILQTEEAGKLKDLLDYVWQCVKIGLVGGVSIGFRARTEDVEPLPTGGVLFNFWEWVELSLVTIPANSEASIDVIRSADKASLVAKDTTGADKNAGASAQKSVSKSQPKGKKMNLKEQLEAAEAKRQAIAARMKSLLQDSGEEGRTLDEQESEEFEGLEADVASVDAQIRRLKSALALASEDAKPVVAKSSEEATKSRRGEPVTMRSREPKGFAFTKTAMALAACKGDVIRAAEYAKSRFGDDARVQLAMKAAVAAGSTTNLEWAGALVNETNMTGEFLELVGPMTAVDKLNGLRRVPFGVRVPRQATASTAYWVGEGAPKPMSNPTFDTVQLNINKLALIAAVTKELVIRSDLDSVQLVQNDMVKSIARELDRSFFDPASVEIPGVRPSSVTNGALEVPATGTDAEALRTDVRTLLNSFLATNQDPSALTWVMSSAMAMSISGLMNPLGQREFPDLRIDGGSFMGIPVVISNNFPSGSGGQIIVLLNQEDILFADNGAATIDYSEQASLQFSTTPDNPTNETTVFRSLWQENLIGIRVERFLTWVRGRDSAVAYISGANYG